jgi:Tfp pilus assembly protein PilO
MDVGTGMDKARQWVALGLLAALVLLVGGWVLLVSPKKAEAALLREQAVAQAAANEQTQSHLQVLRSKSEQVPERTAYLDEVAVKIPPGPALPDLLRALTAAARSAGVDLVSIAPGVATSVVKPGPASAPAPAPVGSGAPTAAVPAGGLHAIPLTIQIVGGFYEVEQFLAELEDLPRALRLTNVALAVGPGAPAPAGSRPGASQLLTTTLTGSVFMDAPPSPATGTAPAPAPALAGQPSETTS